MNVGETFHAEAWACTNTEYHADSANSLSHTEADCFDVSPRLYHGRHLTGEFPRDTSAALDLGTIFHAEALGEPPPYVLIPERVLSASGARSGANWKAFQLAHPGKILVKPDEIAPVQLMLDALRRNRAARYLLWEIEGENEFSIRFACRETGVVRRARLDRKTPEVLVDLKTTRDAAPKGFARAAWDYGYHRQAAWYQDAVEALEGDVRPFLFVVVESAPPYDSAVYSLRQDWIDLGRRQNSRILRRFAACRAAGVWERASFGQVLELSAPPWAIHEQDWEIA